MFVMKLSLVVVFHVFLVGHCEECKFMVNETSQLKLQWRDSPEGILHLEVYYSPSFCNFSSLKSNERVRNPSCNLSSVPLGTDPDLTVEFVRPHAWQSTTLHPIYDIHMAEFRVITEHQGEIVCEIFSEIPEVQPVQTKPLFLWNDERGPQLYLTMLYAASFCELNTCSSLLRKEAKELAGLLQHFRKLRLEPLQIKRGKGGGLEVVYRAWEVGSYSSASASAAATASFKLRIQKRAEAARQKLADRGAHLDQIRGARFCLGDGVWPTTPLGSAALPLLEEDATCAVPRACIGNPATGARWDDAVTRGGEDDACGIEPPHSQMLRKLGENSTESGRRVGSEALFELQFILANVTKSPLSEPDIWNVARVLGSVQREKTLPTGTVASVTAIVNSVLQLNEDQLSAETLSAAQNSSGTSDAILKAVDYIMGTANLSSPQELTVAEKITTLVADTDQTPGKTTPRGLAVKKRDGGKFVPEDVVVLEVGAETAGAEAAAGEGVAAAVLLPDELTTGRLALAVFWDATLFGGGASGLVLSVAAAGRHGRLAQPLWLLFARSPGQGAATCAFWELGDGGGERGHWEEAGCESTAFADDRYDLCVCTHLTHFGKLLYSPGIYEESPALSIVTVAGCSVSLAGLAGVVVSMLLPTGGGGGSGGHWLQMQLCAAQAALMVAFLWDELAPSDATAPCLARGLLLHYATLAQALWSFGAARHQHRRLTRPLEALRGEGRGVSAARAALAWGLPAVACGLLLGLDGLAAYAPPRCYPAGRALLAAVVLPLGCVLLANASIFVVIMWSVSGCAARCDASADADVAVARAEPRSRSARRRLLSATYLFCLLGLSWLFGFLRWQYLFCAAASLQGASHFVFCVLLDRATRRRWRLFGRRRRRDLSSWYYLPQSRASVVTPKRVSAALSKGVVAPSKNDATPWTRTSVIGVARRPSSAHTARISTPM